MITGVAFIPAAPLLCPDVDIESLLADERAASIELVAELQQDVDLVVIIGAGDTTTWFEQGGIGSTRSFGGSSRYPVGTGVEEFPQAITVGASVVVAAGWNGEVKALVVDSEATPALHEVISKELLAKSEHQRTLVVAVGDGTATRTEKAPGYIQPDAISFDEAINEAIGNADLASILTIEQSTADRLWCRGLPVWQVLAHACTPSHSARILESAPFGVNYLVASWRA